MRRALGLATLFLFAVGAPAAELLCVAECDATAATRASDRPPVSGSCHEAARETDDPAPPAIPGCPRHSQDCAMTSARDLSAASASGSATRVFPAAPASSAEPILRIAPAGLASSRARPFGVSPPPLLSSVLRL
jgi:hypothetical protein